MWKALAFSRRDADLDGRLCARRRPKGDAIHSYLDNAYNHHRQDPSRVQDILGVAALRNIAANSKDDPDGLTDQPSVRRDRAWEVLPP